MGRNTEYLMREITDVLSPESVVDSHIVAIVWYRVAISWADA